MKLELDTVRYLVDTVLESPSAEFSKDDVLANICGADPDQDPAELARLATAWEDMVFLGILRYAGGDNYAVNVERLGTGYPQRAEVEAIVADYNAWGTVRKYDRRKIVWEGKGWYQRDGLKSWKRVTCIDHNNPADMRYLVVEDTEAW